MFSFSVLKLWHSYSYSHPNWGTNARIMNLENGYVFLKILFLNLNFQNSG